MGFPSARGCDFFLLENVTKFPKHSWQHGAQRQLDASMRMQQHHLSATLGDAASFLRNSNRQKSPKSPPGSPTGARRSLDPFSKAFPVVPPSSLRLSRYTKENEMYIHKLQRRLRTLGTRRLTDPRTSRRTRRRRRLAPTARRSPSSPLKQDPTKQRYCIRQKRKCERAKKRREDTICEFQKAKPRRVVVSLEI